MCADSGRRKSTSPQASPESSSLQVNRMKNKEDDKPGTSPFILEQCHNLEKFHLKNSLNSKLAKRPGSLELVEKGVLQVDPGIDFLIRGGSIPYPRVGTPRSSLSPISKINGIAESDTNDVFVIPTPSSISSHLHVPGSSSSGLANRNATVATSSCRQRNLSTSRAGAGGATSSVSSIASSGTSRSMRDDTVVYKMGPFVFHNYCPKSSSNNSSGASSSSSTPVTNLFQQKQRAREAQQVEMLRLQDTALAHRLIEQELCELIGGNALQRSEVAEDELCQQETGSTTYNQGDSPFSVCSLQSLSTHSSGTGGVSGPLSTMMITSPPDTEVMSESATSPSVFLSQTAMLTPRRQSGCEAPFVTQKSPLERLTINQLRAECRQRGMSRSGPKANLVRQLEPYRHELTAKYQLSIVETSPVGDCLISPQPGTIRPSTQKLVTSETAVGAAFPVPVSISPGFLHLGPQSGVVTTTTSIPVTSQPYLALSSSSVTDNTVYLYPTLSSDIFPGSSCTSGTQVTSSNCTMNFTGQAGNPVLLQNTTNPTSSSCDPGALRHSASEPQFATVHNPHIVDATLASVQLTAGVSNLLFRSVAAAHSGGSLSNAPCTPPPPPPLSLSSSSSLSALTSSGLPTIIPTHTAAQGVVNVTTLPGSQFCHRPSLCSNPVIDQAIPGSHVRTGETPLAYPSTCTNVPYGGLLESSVPFAAVVTSNSLCPSISSSDHSVGDRQVLPTGQSSSLNQIEAYWLRIRQLRRSLAKVNAFGEILIEAGSTGTHCANPNRLPGVLRGQAVQLEQEHERLCVLCRLLVIDRLDALDELSSNDQTKANISGSGQCLLTSSDLQVERNLLDSYLRKLGGSSILHAGAASSLHPPMTSAFASQTPLVPPTLTAHYTPSRQLSNLPGHFPTESSHLFQINQQQQLSLEVSGPAKTPCPVTQQPQQRHVAQSAVLPSPPTPVLSQRTSQSVFTVSDWSPHGLVPPIPPHQPCAPDSTSTVGTNSSGRGCPPAHDRMPESGSCSVFVSNGPVNHDEGGLRRDVYQNFELPTEDPSTDAYLSPDATDMLFALWDRAASMEEAGTADSVTDMLDDAPAAVEGGVAKLFHRASTRNPDGGGVTTPPLFEVEMDTHEAGNHHHHPYQQCRQVVGICSQAALPLSTNGHVTSGAPTTFLLNSATGVIPTTSPGQHMHFFTTSSFHNDCKSGDTRKPVNSQPHFMDTHSQPVTFPTHSMDGASWPGYCSYGSSVSPAVAMRGSTISSYLDSSEETDCFFNSLDVSDFAELMDTVEAGASSTAATAVPSMLPASGVSTPATRPTANPSLIQVPAVAIP